MRQASAADSLDDSAGAVKSIAVPENSPNQNPVISPKKAETILWIRSRYMKIFLLSLLAIVSLAVAWKNAAKNEGKDFYQFWAIGQSLNQPGINVYANDTRSRLGAEFLERAKQSGNTNLIAVANYRGWLQTYSTPFLYTTFRFFSTGNYETDLRDYRLAMLAALTLGIFIFCRLLNYSWPMAVMILAVLSVWFDPLASDLYVGNVNSLQFGALAVYLWTTTKIRWRYRDLVGGIILGLTLAFKPNLVFVVIVLATHWIIGDNFRRLWFHGLGGIAGGAIAIFFSAISFHDFRCWIEWLSILHTLSNEKVISIQNGNCSPIEIVYEWFHRNMTLAFTIIFIGFAVAMLWMRNFYTLKKGGNQTEFISETFAVAVGCVLTIVASRLTWFHYYVLAIPAFIFLLQRIEMRRGKTIGLIFRQIPFVLSFLALTPVSSMIISPDANQEAALAAGAALLLFLALAISVNPRSQTTAANHQ